MRKRKVKGIARGNGFDLKTVGSFWLLEVCVTGSRFARYYYVV